MALIAYITIDDKKAALELAEALVKNRLAAGVNIIDSVHSIYRWQNEIRAKDEIILLAQTSEAVFEKMQGFIKAHHSYMTPCIIACEITNGSSDFLKWIEANSGGE